MTDFSSIKALFEDCISPQDRYQKILLLGKNLPPFDDSNKVPENIVPGCQSIVYLHSELHNGLMTFTASSDALISSGLAALLLLAYNGEPPEVIIKQKPLFLEELQISTSLTPGRSNGLASMYLRMQQDAVKFLLPN